MRVVWGRTQGYDGVLNGGGTYESGTEGKAFMPGLFHIVVSLAYNAELAEHRALVRMRLTAA